MKRLPIGARLAVATLAALALAAFAAPWIGQALDLDPADADISSHDLGPSWAHPLGTDEIGRDVFIRLLFGARVSLLVGAGAAVLAAAIGTTIGLVAGWRGGVLDAWLMRFTDGVISLPLLPLLIVLSAVDPAKLGLPDGLVSPEFSSIARVILITALVGWTTVARLVRGEVLKLRGRDFVRAATAMGASSARIMARHLLPNALAPILVATTLAVGNIILFESVLSFLGLGVQPPTPSWGNMLNGAQETIWSAPARAFYPGVLILITVACCNLFGDGMLAALDPKRSGRR